MSTVLSPSSEAADAMAPASARLFDVRDLLAVGLILAGFAVALLLMPIQHDFAIMDDWTYVRGVEKVISGQGLVPSEYAQATLITHTLWGALFAWLFGMSFTSLTAANMAVAMVAALAFYALLRRIGYEPGLSGLGVALLTLNPYFINLTYSFMTEINFLAMLLLAALFYFEGLKSKVESPKSKVESGKNLGLWTLDLGLRDGWLWLGSIFAALAFLTRQFGMAVALAAFLWLLYGRRLTWRSAAAVLLIPLIAVVGYYVWNSRFPVTFSGSVSREEMLNLLSPATYVRRASHFLYLGLFLPAVLVPLYGRVRNWKLWVPLALLAGAGAFVLWQLKYDLVAQGESTLNELSYYWLQFSIPDPSPLYIMGAALTVLLIGSLAERAWPGFVALVRRRREPVPTDFLYAAALVLFAGTYLVSAGFLDRYWLPILPFIIAGGLANVRAWPKWALGAVVAWVAVLGVYSSLLHLDQYDLVDANWRAGRWLVSQGVPYDKMRVGYSWDGYQLHDTPRERLGTLDIRVRGRTFPPHQISDPVYIVASEEQPGYSVINRFPYVSRLGGMTTHEMLAMKRE